MQRDNRTYSYCHPNQHMHAFTNLTDQLSLRMLYLYATITTNSCLGYSSRSVIMMMTIIYGILQNFMILGITNMPYFIDRYVERVRMTVGHKDFRSLMMTQYLMQNAMTWLTCKVVTTKKNLISGATLLFNLASGGYDTAVERWG